jgi:hypothetical protein
MAASRGHSTSTLDARESDVKIAALTVIVAVIGFWLGYTVSGYNQGTLELAMFRFSQLYNANLNLRFADLVDAGDIPKLRKRLLLISHVELTSAEPTEQVPLGDMTSWPSLKKSVVWPFHDRQVLLAYYEDQFAWLKGNVETHLATLCKASPSDKDYDVACAR